MQEDGGHRICLAVHYDGSAFYGWQLQRSERTVQGELERVLSRLLDRPVRILGAGRTDRGVHALGQYATLDVPARWSPASLRRALNALLPPDLWIAGAWRVAPEFHPRYDALDRTYHYRLGLTEASASPFYARWCWALARPVELDAMQGACGLIVGDHSFRAFAKSGQEERGDRCTITAARWIPWDEVGLTFEVTANRFLHHMVRYLVGTMVAVGLGARPGADIASLLAGESGVLTSPPAPPQGLYLTGVRYPAPPYGPEPSPWAVQAAEAPRPHPYDQNNDP